MTKLDSPLATTTVDEPSMKDGTDNVGTASGIGLDGAETSNAMDVIANQTNSSPKDFRRARVKGSSRFKGVWLLLFLMWKMMERFFIRINELESHMLDGKLVLVGDDGKPLKSMLPSSSTLASKKVNKASKSGSGVGNKIFYEQWKETYDEDPYDDDDCVDPGLTNA
ncbi:hypothetical protein Tco_1316219 [Tanacetum coccineum]